MPSTWPEDPQRRGRRGNSGSRDRNLRNATEGRPAGVQKSGRPLSLLIVLAALAALILAVCA